MDVEIRKTTNERAATFSARPKGPADCTFCRVQNPENLRRKICEHPVLFLYWEKQHFATV